MSAWDSTHKLCGNCFKVKSLSEFYRKGKTWQNECKPCRTEICYIYKYGHDDARIEKYLEKREALDKC